MSISEGLPVVLNVLAQDTDSGLASITVTADDNATVAVPSFAPGTNEAVTVRAEKLDPSRGARVELEVRDVAGNAVRCDPVVVNLSIPVDSQEGRVSQSVSGVPKLENKLSLRNGTPGATLLELTVNGG